MRAEPDRSGAVTAFAAHSFADVELARLLLFRYIQRVTGQTFGTCRGVADVQQFAHPPRDGSLQCPVGLIVFVLQYPGAELVLQDAAVFCWRNTAMACGGAARAGANEFRLAARLR